MERKTKVHRERVTTSSRGDDAYGIKTSWSVTQTLIFSFFMEQAAAPALPTFVNEISDMKLAQQEEFVIDRVSERKTLIIKPTASARRQEFGENDTLNFKVSAASNYYMNINRAVLTCDIKINETTTEGVMYKQGVTGGNTQWLPTVANAASAAIDGPRRAHVMTLQGGGRALIREITVRQGGTILMNIKDYDTIQRVTHNLGVGGERSAELLDRSSGYWCDAFYGVYPYLSTTNAGFMPPRQTSHVHPFSVYRTHRKVQVCLHTLFSMAKYVPTFNLTLPIEIELTLNTPARMFSPSRTIAAYDWNTAFANTTRPSVSYGEVVPQAELGAAAAGPAFAYWSHTGTTYTTRNWQLLMEGLGGAPGMNLSVGDYSWQGYEYQVMAEQQISNGTSFDLTIPLQRSSIKYIVYWGSPATAGTAPTTNYAGYTVNGTGAVVELQNMMTSLRLKENQLDTAHTMPIKEIYITLGGTKYPTDMTCRSNFDSYVMLSKAFGGLDLDGVMEQYTIPYTMPHNTNKTDPRKYVVLPGISNAEDIWQYPERCGKVDWHMPETFEFPNTAYLNEMDEDGPGMLDLSVGAVPPGNVLLGAGRGCRSYHVWDFTRLVDNPEVIGGIDSEKRHLILHAAFHTNALPEGWSHNVMTVSDSLYMIEGAQGRINVQD